MATPTDIENRKLAALRYKTIFSTLRKNGGRGANEISVAYRSHGKSNSSFPMFAEQAAKGHPHVLVGTDLQTTGKMITDDGRFETVQF